MEGGFVRADRISVEITFKVKKKEGRITVRDGRAQVEFEDARLQGLLQEMVNTRQEITFKSQNVDGTPRVNVSQAVPAEDDGMLVYFLQSGVPGIKKPIEIIGISGSDKVTFNG